MDRDRSFESDKIIENIEEENLEENKTNEEYFEALIYYLQTQEEEIYHLLEQEASKSKENFVLFDFLNKVKNYNENIKIYGDYGKLHGDYINNIKELKKLLNRDDMSLEEFVEYMERIVPESTINKGVLIVDDGSLQMICKKNRKLNVGQKATFLSDYFKYSIELKDPYHIILSTPLLKLMNFTLVLEDCYLIFDLKEATQEEFIYELELPYLAINEYEYKLIAKDEKLSNM